MARRNLMLEKRDAQRDAVWKARLEHEIDFALQLAKDMALIAAHDTFGAGPERANEFSRNYDTAWKEYAEMCIADAKDDKEIWVTKDKVDSRLKLICGERFMPWEERYR